mmetsp:Transcript_40458/g.60679  ORF Transcript_40458/g.60679 Transcript_40458/m.60679 type:complete len:312 (-) Transcript_40458:261-1196(-)
MKNMYNNYADDMKNMYNNHPNANTSSITNRNESKKKNNDDRELNLAAKQQATIAKQWRKEVCTPGHEDLVCHHVFVLTKRKATFCSAAKVASTTTKDYFYKISDGEVVIPPNARFGAHEGDWKRLAFIDDEIRQNVLHNRRWTNVFFVRHVIDRFISGYLDKIKMGCAKPKRDQRVIDHYRPLGFSCEKHSNLEAFVTFLEGTPLREWEGHFAPQVPLCNPNQFPYTDVIIADEHLNEKLEELSAKMGVEHPKGDKKTTSHGTGAKNMLVSIFKDQPELIERLLVLFKEDCDMYPDLCDVGDLHKAIALDK